MNTRGKAEGGTRWATELPQKPAALRRSLPFMVMFNHPHMLKVTIRSVSLCPFTVAKDMAWGKADEGILFHQDMGCSVIRGHSVLQASRVECWK